MSTLEQADHQNRRYSHRTDHHWHHWPLLHFFLSLYTFVDTPGTYRTVWTPSRRCYCTFGKSWHIHAVLPWTAGKAILAEEELAFSRRRRREACRQPQWMQMHLWDAGFCLCNNSSHWGLSLPSTLRIDHLLNTSHLSRSLPSDLPQQNTGQLVLHGFALIYCSVPILNIKRSLKVNAFVCVFTRPTGFAWWRHVVSQWCVHDKRLWIKLWACNTGKKMTVRHKSVKGRRETSRWASGLSNCNGVKWIRSLLLMSFRALQSICYVLYTAAIQYADYDTLAKV